MRVLVVTIVHVPLDARIHHRQIRALRGAGAEVTYAAPWGATGTPPGQAIDGLRTIDLPRAVGRRRLRPLRAARRLIRREGPGHDVVLLHDPELVFGVVGRLGRLPPVVLDVHEDLAASLVDRSWVPAPIQPLARWFSGRMESWAERHLHLLLAEEEYAPRFRQDHPFVPNLPWLPPHPVQAGCEDRVVYIGRISEARGALDLIGVGERLRDAGGPSLELVGAADADIRAQIEAADARGVVRWHGFLPNEAALEVAQGAIAGLSLLHDLENYRVSMPTKVVEYLAVGIPAITTPLPRAARLVTDAGAGVVVPFGDPEAAAEAVLRFAGDRAATARMGAAGRAAVAADLSWDAEAPRFVAHLERLAGVGR